MPLTMHTLKPARGAKRRSKRVGRGNASGKGTYSTRGMKGQKARSGGRSGLKQLGLRRILLSIPKRRGFKSIHPRARAIRLGALEKLVENGQVVDHARLVKLGLACGGERVKLLGEGRFTKSITFKGIPLSKKARELIEAAGGNIEK